MTREFTGLTAGEQRAVLYEKITSIEDHIVKQNSNISKNCHDILVVKVIGAVLFIAFCLATGLGIPHIPGL